MSPKKPFLYLSIVATYHAIDRVAYPKSAANMVVDTQPSVERDTVAVAQLADFKNASVLPHDEH
jgi:hypothetical protein